MRSTLRNILPISSKGNVLEDYNAGIRSVQDTARAVTSWDEFPVREIFGLLSEERLFELLQALLQDDPSLPARCLPQTGGTLLHYALAWSTGRSFRGDPPAAISTRVLVLLSPPEVTRVQGKCCAARRSFQGLPLHLAAVAGGAYRELIDRLVCLDPDVLLMASSEGQVPLHLALLAHIPLPVPALARMVELRPTSLLHRDGLGRSAVALALECCPDPNDPGLAELLTSCVTRFPEALRPPKPNEAPGPGPANEDTTPLMGACQRFSGHRDLLRALVGADPSALAVPLRRPWRQVPSPLPFQVVRAEAAVAKIPTLNELTRFLEDETLHLALAAAEYFAMGGGGGGGGGGVAATAEGADDEDAVTAFQRRLRDVVPRYLAVPAPAPGVEARLHKEGSPQRKRRRRRPHPPPPPSAFVVAQSIRALDNNRMVFCQELFLRPFRRDLLLGDAVISLYLLNRQQDRSNPDPRRQVQMLASVSDHLDCIYLQFREHGSRLLIS